MHKQTQIAQPEPASKSATACNQTAVPEAGFLRIGSVQKLLGKVSRSTVYELAKTSGFPRPIRLSRRHAVWDRAEVQEWISARIEAARSTKKS